jgi:DNA polymerase-3 subunit epsilon
LDFAADSSLVQRALSAIRGTPMPTEVLARTVFGLKQAPPGLASRLVYELLGTDRRVEVDRQGVWRLTAVPSLGVDTQLDELDYAVVDVETTGSSVTRGARIVEIAVVQVSGGRVSGEFESLVNPGLAIPRWVSRLTGIDSGMVAGAPRFEDVAGVVQENLRGRVFVAHNVGFDWRFVAEEMRRSRSLLPSGPRLCTVKLARRALPGLRRRGLDSLARFYDVEIVGRHRAGGDARATASILLRLLAAADRQGVNTWRNLQQWLTGSLAPTPAAPPDGHTAEA